MASLEQPILISFKLCPFVQRSVITLLHKKIDFTIEYINLRKKPDWFLEISPLGKVPLLRVKEHVLFESAVINEYLDETHGERMLPEDPLARAEHRAWIEFSTSLFNAQHQLTQARREETYYKIEEDLTKKLAPLERKIGDQGFFEGDSFSLVDSAFAPFLMRSQIVADNIGVDPVSDYKKISKWRKNLLSLPEVQKSVVKDFEDLYMEGIYERGGYLADQ
ncbi:glutathione S-transferase family protein [Kangiella sediminilitoris]|uniref:glutathione transferase n=1 Tax=Kangiella sediminilitoris TaxID=1144748 RepID=A0A1B3BDD7_9GAMM|nr:glutathione S-transferase family protein [Kangiella sediminilitoris]AOE50773.1 Glutathione S-transferase domain protein [Kangiella sediminilitoris]